MGNPGLAVGSYKSTEGPTPCTANAVMPYAGFVSTFNRFLPASQQVEQERKAVTAGRNLLLLNEGAEQDSRIAHPVLLLIIEAFFKDCVPVTLQQHHTRIWPAAAGLSGLAIVGRLRPGETALDFQVQGKH